MTTRTYNINRADEFLLNTNPGRWAESGCFCLADLFSHLESSLLQGVVNYEVSRTTLEDVFLQLEGEEAIGQEGKTLTPVCKCGTIMVPYIHMFSLNI